MRTTTRPVPRRWNVRRWFFGFTGVAILYIGLSGVLLQVDKPGTPLRRLENAEWVATSRWWIDRQMCNWFSLCGTLHLNSNGWTWSNSRDEIPNPIDDPTGFWTSDEEDPESWTKGEIKKREIPQYIFDYAPYVHLFSGEEFWPSDLGEHLVHCSPRLNYTLIPEMKNDRNLSNLHELDAIEKGRHGRWVYLQSDDNVEEKPEWLSSREGIPSTPDMRDGGLWSVEGEAEDVTGVAGSQQTVAGHGDDVGAEALPAWLSGDLTPSTDGQCGGISGFTCKGSKFGQCCSIHGWCGKTNEHCDEYCDPLHGRCNDPLHPPQGPKPDLRRHKRELGGARHRPNPAGMSTAPAILIVIDKGDGIVDAFWFFFYSFNQGQKVFRVRYGNHVGDWEHTLVRFRDGQPETVFLSEHDFGEAYAWHAMEKYLPNPDGSGTMLESWTNHTAAKVAKRPVVYSAVGSHAMYATSGLHPYILPWGLLHDQTDRGPLWDPAKNVQSYRYDLKDHSMRASTRNPKSPTSWLHYAGHWGDKYYPLSDPRQYRFAGQYHYVNGPTGPKFKNLARKEVCQGHKACHIKHWLGGGRAKRLPLEEDVEEGGLPGGNMTDDAT